MAYWIPMELRNIHLPLYFDDKRCRKEDKRGHYLSDRMTRWIPPGLKNIHIPLFFDDNRCSKRPVRTNNVIGLIPPELKNIHIPSFFNENRYLDEDNRNGNALIRNLKAKRDRITELFRYRRTEARGVQINPVEDANMTKNEKKKKKKKKKKNIKKKKEKIEKQEKKEMKEDKRKRKVEPTQKNADIREEDKHIPNQKDEITDEVANDAKKAWTILSCFGFVSSWWSGKKQQRKERKKKNRRVKFSRSVSVKIYEPMSTYDNKCGLDARHVDDVGIHVF